MASRFKSRPTRVSGGALKTNIRIVWHNHLTFDTRRAADYVSALARQEMLSAVSEGKDVRNRRYKPYDDRSRFTGTPDLRDTGRLLDSVRERRRLIRSTGFTVWIGPSDDQIRKALGLHRDRPWIGLRRSAIKAIVRRLSLYRRLLRWEPGPPRR